MSAGDPPPGSPAPAPAPSTPPRPREIAAASGPDPDEAPPAGYGFDGQPLRDRGLLRRLRHLVRGMVKRPLLWIGLRIAPALYFAYCRFVWWTSTVEDEMQPLHGIIRDHDGAVGCLWHEEVFTVAWAYRDFHPHTLASVGDSGEAISRLLTRMGFVVFRGGTARNRLSATSRRREVLPAMIEHMKTTREVIYGLTVDGSRGPRYRMKTGACAIARECKRPVILVRTWSSRHVRVGTWDRMAIPLPFGRIHRLLAGPFYPPEDAHTPEGLERFRRRVERELQLLAAESYRRAGQRIPAELQACLDEEPLAQDPSASSPARARSAALGRAPADAPRP